MTDAAIHFDPNQDFQRRAIEAVLNLFKGQSLVQSQFEMGTGSAGTLFTDRGIGNMLDLADEAIADNARSVQLDGGIPDDFRLDHGELPESLDFSVEMETGTGTTYVYLRTIFELNRLYGFTKFVIVVPSIAIREGVLSNLRLLRDHLRDLYDGVAYSSMVYDSKRPADLRSFAQNTQLSILVINIDAFNKRDSNLIYQPQDQMMGDKPIDLLRSTKPVLVLDEPQNMEGTTAKEALGNLNGLFTLRYSATHRDKYTLIHRLTPADALAEGLVKQIEVWSVVEDQDLNRPNIEVVSITPSKSGVSAKVRIDSVDSNGVKPRTVTVKGVGEDLFELSGQRSLYDGYQVEEIDAARSTIEFSNGIRIERGVRFGADRDAIQKTQISTAVREHLDKELDVHRRVTSGELRAHIKVLSLFFIDRVANYVGPDAKFRRWFVEAYEELAQFSRYEVLALPPIDAVHGGYFAETGKGKAKDTRGTSKDDARAYELIMQKKDELILGDEPLRFIFSHSALREGWDNPNVFVITTLNDTKSEMKKRQEIGRGLRLPVMRDGTRCQDNSINRLTVIANEAYDDFAATLQKEIESETGTKFERDKVKNRRKRKTVRLREGILDNPDFKALWEAIKHRTQYRVTYDADKVADRASKSLAEAQDLQPPKLRTTKAVLTVDTEKGVSAEVVADRAPTELASSYPIPDLLGHLARSLPVSRALIRRVLVGSGKLGQVTINPQRFIDLTHDAIEHALMEELAAGITYEMISTGDQAVYAIRLLEETELTSYLTNIVEDVENSAYEDVIVDSGVERDFARALSLRTDNIKVFLKLGSPSRSVGHVRPGRGGQWPPRSSRHRAMRLSADRNP